MKRKLALYGLLIGLIIYGVPYLSGEYVAYRFKQFGQQMSRGKFITITPLSYERGWRKSLAKTRITLKAGDIKQQIEKFETNVAHQSTDNAAQKTNHPPISFILDHKIWHGPFIKLRSENQSQWEFALGVIQSQLDLTEEAKALLKKEIGKTDILDLHSKIDLDGEIVIQLTIEPITVEHEGTRQVVWEGVKRYWVF